MEGKGKMPKAAERNLKKEAKKHHMKPGSRRYNAYVYGTAMRIARKEKRRKRRKT
jgi:hypothetical protein